MTSVNIQHYSTTRSSLGLLVNVVNMKSAGSGANSGGVVRFGYNGTVMGSSLRLQ